MLAAVIASFDKRYEKLIADSPDVKKGMDLMQASIVITRQFGLQRHTKIPR
jgi:hypothetical protein